MRCEMPPTMRMISLKRRGTVLADGIRVGPDYREKAIAGALQAATDLHAARQTDPVPADVRSRRRVGSLIGSLSAIDRRARGRGRGAAIDKDLRALDI